MFQSKHIIRNTGILFLIIGFLLSGFYFYPPELKFYNFISQFYANFSAEFISIAITILLINYLYEIKEKQNLKRRLIRELGSEERAISSNALVEIREKGWLTDGSLKNANLLNCNLSNQDLTGADLENAKLNNAELSNTTLKNVNFSKANLSICCFARVACRM